MRLVRVLVATATVVLVIGAAVGPSGADAASGAQLLAGPTTGLVDGQAILVTGTGFAPNKAFHLYECRTFGGCVSLDASAVTDASGRFGTVGHVRRGYDDSGTPVDCAATQCFVAVSSSTADAPPMEPSWVSLSFAVRPTVSVVANRRLADGQAVTVEGRDFVPGQTVNVLECPSSPCTNSLPGSAVVDRDGRVSIPTTVRRWVYDWAASGGDLPMDCSVSGCSLALAVHGYYEDNYETLASAHLNFARTPAIFTSGAGTWEGDTGAHPVEVRFGVTPSSRRPQVLRFTTYAWTATAADFQPIEGTVVVQPGETEGSITVDVRGDTEVEGDEVFLVVFRGTRHLSNVSGVAGIQIHDDSDG
jgi:Neocarzinostatin family/Calx-beta domain